MTIQKGDPRIVGAYSGKQLPDALQPLTQAVLAVLPDGYVVAPSMYAGEFPRVAVLVPGAKDVIATADVDQELGTFLGLESIETLAPPAGSAAAQPVDVVEHAVETPLQPAVIAEPVNGGLAQSVVITNPAPASDTKVMATPKAAAKKILGARKAAKATKAKPKSKAKAKPAAKKVATKITITEPRPGMLKAAVEANKGKMQKAITKAIRAAVSGEPKVSKTAAVIALLERPQGATAADIAGATEWLPHSIRGFMATLKTKRGLAVTSAKVDGVQTWKIEPAEELV